MSAVSESYLAHTNPHIFITDIKRIMPTANKPAARKSDVFIAHNRKNTPQTFNQKFSARIASAVKRVESLSHKLQLTQAMLGDFLTEAAMENPKIVAIVKEYNDNPRYDLETAILRLNDLSKSLREYNRNKASL